MGRPKKIDQSIKVFSAIPESVYSRVQLELYSEIEGKIPHGKLSDLITELLRDWLTDRGVVV